MFPILKVQIRIKKAEKELNSLFNYTIYWSKIQIINMYEKDRYTENNYKKIRKIELN